MNARQQITTGLMALLMLGTIVLMPARFPSHATYSSSVVRQSGALISLSQVSPELPQDQVRDLTYN
jgi:hypothetical protein